MEEGRKPNVTTAIVVFDRDVRVSKLKELVENFHGDVVIMRKLIIDEDLNVNCNIYVLGNIRYKNRLHEYSINVHGDIFCYDEIDCYDINVSGCLYCEGDVYSKNIKVGEDFVCNTKVDAFGCQIVVAGNFECYSLEAKKVTCLGNMDVQGSITLAEGIKCGY